MKIKIEAVSAIKVVDTLLAGFLERQREEGFEARDKDVQQLSRLGDLKLQVREAKDSNRELEELLGGKNISGS